MSNHFVTFNYFTTVISISTNVRIHSLKASIYVQSYQIPNRYFMYISTFNA